MSDPTVDCNTAPPTGALATLSDQITFLRGWLGSPRRVGAIAPSSAGLAALICSEIDSGHAPVLELGPGTGVFTEALLARGLDAKHLTLVESTPAFAELLRKRFPTARVLSHDAASLSGIALYAGERAGAAVSGLPLRAMPPSTIDEVIAGVFRWLRPGASLYQFTYGLRCPIPAATLARHGLAAQAIGRVWRNLPPATVYRIRKRSP
jgi:phospholipid N-methyltransferase